VERERDKKLQEESKKKEAATRDGMIVKEIVKRAEREEAVWARRGRELLLNFPH
jgi:hypothetical protein